MPEHREFTIQQIVWAAVEEYPPWPAKIVRKLKHNGKTAYKVNFFGDPTYCYLHCDSLTPFNRSETIEPTVVEQNFKLKRAIELAKFSISKQFDSISCINNQPVIKGIQTPTSPTTTDQTYAQSKDVIDLPQKNQQLQRHDTNQTSSNDFVIDSITPSNVLQILEDYQKGEMTQRLRNLKRKQIICFQNHLKQNLLFKYNLHAVDFLKQTPKSQPIISNPIKELRTSKKLKKKQQPTKLDDKIQCMRKIQKILYQKGMDRKMTYETTIKMVNQIQKKSQGMNPSCFKQSIIRMIHQVSSNMKQIQQVELEYIEKNIFSYLDLQFHQNKLEEGSRMTQMYQEFAV